MNERGSTILMVTLSMTALLSIVALAVDVGMLFDVRTEAQRTADAAALAGAGTFVMKGDLSAADEDIARAEAINIGERNLVYGDSAQILPEDVEVDLEQGRVTVTVRRIGDRGNAIPTWFANVFGTAQADVAARATAAIAPAGAATCLKPFAIPDAFLDVNGDGVYDPGVDQYDPDEHGYGSSWRNAGEPGSDGTGFNDDFGRPIVLKAGGGNGNGNGNGGVSETYPGTGPSWYYPWAMPSTLGGPANGADRYRWNIANCNPVVVSVEDEYDVEPGAMTGPTVQGIEDLIALDPWASWDAGSNTVTGSAYAPGWEGSPRIGIVPVYNPGREFDPGRKPVEFTNFIAVFFEGVEGNGNDQVVYGRVLYPRGVGGGEAVAPAAQFVRLIE
ncbi:MAG TPA: Tad domain-containing protein [Gemmatimonadota bacterium]|nr:Tad domain-containing protein [Gemmatimonadota bacterium]